MEEKLQWLLSLNHENRRAKAVDELRKRGKKLIGLVAGAVPEEVILAAGMIPVRLSGTWRANVADAQAYRPAGTDPFCTHLLQSILQGEWDQLDGIAVPYYDDDVRRLWDVLVHLGWKPFNYMLYVPYRSDESCRRMYRRGLEKFAKAAGAYSGVEVSDESLWDSIAVYNRWRTALSRVYELRKRTRPAISGGDCLRLTTASFVMAKDEYTDELEALLPYLELREVDLAGPRILVSSDFLDQPGYLDLIEEAGATVAMDDLDTGSRYFWRHVEKGGDALQALADRYLLLPPGPRSYEWQRHLDQVKQWASDYRIDGVINLVQVYGQWRQVEVPYFQETLNKAGIPNMSFEREYRLSAVGQLKTRVGAFVESIAFDGHGTTSAEVAPSGGG